MNGISKQNKLVSYELLDRSEWIFREGKIDEHLAGKRVMITGAGGSIGSVVARRVSWAAVDSINLVDHSELSIFNLLNERSLTAPHCPTIVDVCSRQIQEVIREWKPDIIIHAAAFKHVGLMESNPFSAYHNNVLGTIQLARWAQESGVKQFLFVSTDKAVNPTNYMGASKRLAEAWLLTHIRSMLKICRFGNVLGSSGSLVEIVVNRLRAGQPIVITNPDMERYFITPKEAAGLILSSLTFEGCGPFTLEMGTPIKITDLVNRISEQLGLPAEISFGCEGAGEKIHEELVNPGEIKSITGHPGIFSLSAPSFSNISRLIQSVGTRHLDMVAAANKLEVGDEDCYQL